MVDISGPPAVNFYSMLSGLGDTIAQNRKDNLRKEALAVATTPGPDGTVDFSKAITGLANAGDLQGAQLFATLQAHKDALAHQSTADARQAAQDKLANEHWQASFGLQQRAAERADKDKFLVKEVTDPITGATTLVRVNTEGPEGPIKTGAPATTPINPFSEGGKFNADQAKAAGFTDRMLQSEGVLRGADGQPGVENQGTNLTQNTLSKIPVIGNYAVSSDRQRYEQAKRDFVNAQLRRESGAAISSGEFESADKQYFPVPGDSPEVIKQKAKNRQAAVSAMGRESGSAYRPKAIYTDDGRIIPVPPKSSGQGNGADALLQQAREAIQAGAPRDKVIQRLQGAGIDPGSL